MEHETLSNIGLSILLIPIVGAFLIPLLIGFRIDLKTPPVIEPSKTINKFIWLISVILLSSIFLIDNPGIKLNIFSFTLFPLIIYFIYRGTKLKGGLKEKSLTGQKVEGLTNMFFGAWHTAYNSGIYLISFILLYILYLQIFRS